MAPSPPVTTKVSSSRSPKTPCNPNWGTGVLASTPSRLAEPFNPAPPESSVSSTRVRPSSQDPLPLSTPSLPKSTHPWIAATWVASPTSPSPSPWPTVNHRTLSSPLSNTRTACPSRMVPLTNANADCLPSMLVKVCCPSGFSVIRSSAPTSRSSTVEQTP
eukprot:PhF_6_TR3679/c0_g1_i1/m.5221